MTWLSLIFFNALVMVSGMVTLTHADSHASDERKRDYSGVAVWLEQARAADAAGRGAPKHALMLQKDKRFTPHVLVVQSGTVVDFPNQDEIFHNAFSTFDGKLFDIGLYPPKTSRSVTFDRPGVVRVFCNIHSTMLAVIVVVDTPYFATTHSDGSFAIHAVPPGDYILHFFYERALPETLDQLTRTLTVSTDSESVGTVAISQAGYLPVPHKNKYGRDYAPDLTRYHTGVQ